MELDKQSSATEISEAAKIPETVPQGSPARDETKKEEKESGKMTNMSSQVENKDDRDSDDSELEIVMVEPARGRRRKRRVKYKNSHIDGEKVTDKFGRTSVEGRSRSVTSSETSDYSRSSSRSSDENERVSYRVSVLKPCSPGGNTDMFGRNIPRGQPKSRSNSSASEQSCSRSRSKSPDPIEKSQILPEGEKTSEVTYVISSESDADDDLKEEKNNKMNDEKK